MSEALNFPNNPFQGQLFQAGLLRYQWDGGKWRRLLDAVASITSSNNTVTDIISITQEDYDALSPPNATTLYLIVEP